LVGLAAFGQEGVEAVLELMRSEFELVMKGMGIRDLQFIMPEYVRTKAT
jgi:isopentenyl diphosphate isomerase/L-lactate dehydrogenase-like FMN-dependent dehydrogenase